MSNVPLSISFCGWLFLRMFSLLEILWEEIILHSKFYGKRKKRSLHWYLTALDRAKIDMNIAPFAPFIAERVEDSMKTGSAKGIAKT
jgi:hypothetical protein